MPTPPPSADKIALALRLAKDSANSFREIARQTGLSPSTVGRYCRPDAPPWKPPVQPMTPPQGKGKVRFSPEAAAALEEESDDYTPPYPGFTTPDLPFGKHEKPPDCDLPDSIAPPYVPHVIDYPGEWLILSDIHLPYHDRTVIQLAVGEAKKRGVAGVILNGDILDSHEISDFDKDPTAPRYVEEVEIGRKFLAWLRAQLPKATVVFKQGNHDDRLERYVIRRAPALFGLKGLDLPSLLQFQDYGVEWVGDKRIIQLGRLSIAHGHEWRGSGGVNPARWVYLRARSVALIGHFHRTSEHHSMNIRGKPEAAWSVGCACALHPRYDPLADWNQGFAFVKVFAGGDFAVENRMVFNGKIV